MNNGEMIVGAIRSEEGGWFNVVGAAGPPVRVRKPDVKKRTDIKTSLMPQGLTLGLKPEDFTDLLAYLETLRGK